MTEVKVNVKVKVSGKKEKKGRKKRKDAGVKRGIKNPRLQTGSIDFRTIGTQNLTSLIGSIASTQQVKNIDQNLANELRKKNEEIEKLKELEKNQKTTAIVKRKPQDIIAHKINPAFSYKQEILDEKLGDIYQKEREKNMKKAMSNRLANERKEAEKVARNLKSVNEELLQKNQTAEQKHQERMENVINIIGRQQKEKHKLMTMTNRQENYLTEEQKQQLERESKYEILSPDEKKEAQQSYEEDIRKYAIAQLRDDFERGQEEKPAYEEGGGGGFVPELKQTQSVSPPPAVSEFKPSLPPPLPPRGEKAEEPYKPSEKTLNQISSYSDGKLAAKFRLYQTTSRQKPETSKESILFNLLKDEAMKRQTQQRGRIAERLRRKEETKNPLREDDEEIFDTD
jgi:hypothetical protein